MKRDRVPRKIYGLIAAALMLATLSGCAGQTMDSVSAAEEETAYHLSVLLPVTGELSYLGEDAKWAVEYAIDEINASGGIRGIPVRLDLYDSESSEGQAKSQAKAIAKNERFLIGPIDSVGTTAVSEIVAKTGMPNVAAYSYESIRNETAPYGISYMSDTMEGEFAAIEVWKKTNPDIQEVAVLVSKGENSQLETAGLLKERLPEISMEVCDVVEIDASVNDGLNAVAQALNTKADGYIVLARAPDYELMISELRNRGVAEGRRFTASFASYDKAMITKKPETFADSYIWNKFDANYVGEDWQQLLTAYQNDHGGNIPDTNIVSDLYNAVYAWKQCMEELSLKPGVQDLEKEKEAIAEWFFNSSVLHGVQGDYQWVNGNKKSTVYYFRLRADSSQESVAE